MAKQKRWHVQRPCVRDKGKKTVSLEHKELEGSIEGKKKEDRERTTPHKCLKVYIEDFGLHSKSSREQIKCSKQKTNMIDYSIMS